MTAPGRPPGPSSIQRTARMYPLEVVRVWAPATGHVLDSGTDVHALTDGDLAVAFARAWDTPNTHDLRVLAVEQARRWGELEERAG